MADISKITLPSGNSYDLKDAAAREAIAALQGGSYFLGKSTTAIEDQATTNPISIDGETDPVTATNGNVVVYGNKEFIFNGTKWIEFGDLSMLGDLAVLDEVVLSKGSGDNVLGEGTSFTNAASAVSFAAHTTDNVLGADATFSASVTASKSNIKATASGATVGVKTTDTFVKSYPGATSKMVKASVVGIDSNTAVTIPNVTSAGAADTWAFSMGSGNDAETLIISGGNGTAATLGTAISASYVVSASAQDVATGSLAVDGTGADVMTGLGTPTTAAAATEVEMTAQPTVALALNAAAGDGVVEIATDIASASVSVDSADTVAAITALGAGTAAAQTITVGNEDRLKVALYDDLSVAAQ